jgi:hypothetical protein
MWSIFVATALVSAVWAAVPADKVTNVRFHEKNCAH